MTWWQIQLLVNSFSAPRNLFYQNTDFCTQKLIVHEPIYGAYTEIFAGFSPEITASQNGAASKRERESRNLHLESVDRLTMPFNLVAPWGRINHHLRKDLVLAQRTEEEGGTGVAEKFWEWTDEQVKPYV